MTKRANGARTFEAKETAAGVVKANAACSNSAGVGNAMAKRLLSVLMAVVLAVGLMPLPAFAVSDVGSGAASGAQAAGGAKLAAGSATLGAQAESYGVSIATEYASHGLVAYSYNGGDYVGPSESLLLTGAAQSTVAAKAEPRCGWVFTGWKEGGGVSTDNPYSFTLTQSRSLTATFAWSSDTYCEPPIVYLDGAELDNFFVNAINAADQKNETTSYGRLELVSGDTWSDSAQVHYEIFTETPANFVGGLDTYVNTISLYQTASSGFRPQAKKYEGPLTVPMGISYVKYVVLDDLDTSVFPYVFKKCSEEYVIKIEREKPTLHYSCVSFIGTVSGTTLGEHDVGSEVTVKASPAEGFEFLGWVDTLSNNRVSTNAEYSFTLEKSTSLVALFAIRSGVAINETNFPDAAFRSFVKATYDTDGDDWLAESESANVTEMNCANKRIASIQGIENFPSLKNLNVSTNQITAVDVSSLAALEVLKAGSNQIASINLSANPALKELNLDTNKLTAIDVSKLPQLTKLLVYDNDLAALDVSGNPLLANLQCHGNEFTQLDLRANDYLRQAVLAGTKDASNADYDNYTKTVNFVYTTLRVDKGTAVFVAPVYRVEVATDAGGTATATPAYGTQGTEATLSATPNAGYEFAGWQVVSGGVEIASPSSVNATFAIGSADVQVKATWKAKEVSPDPDPKPDPTPTPSPDPKPTPSPDPAPVVKKASSISLAGQTLTYTGKAIAYTGKVTKSGSTGKVTYAYYADAACAKAVAAANVKNVGTYYVRATVAADANYEAATSKAAKLVIAKAKAKVVSKPAAKKSLVFNGKAKALAAAGKASGGAMRYSLDGKKWSASIPKAKNAGTYTVHYKAVATDSNHVASAVGKLKVAVAKAKNTLSAKGKTANVSLKKLKAAAQTVKKSKAFTVKNAKGAVTFKISKYVTPKAKGRLTLSKSGTFKVKKGTPKGTYKVKVGVTAKGAANYNKLTKTVAVAIVVK